MDSKLKTALIWYSVFILFCGFNLPVYAYVLQGPHVIDLMIAKLGNAKSLFVSQRLIFHRVGTPEVEEQSAAQRDSGPSVDSEDGHVRATQDIHKDENSVTPETLELEESLRFVFSRAFRSDAKSLQSERIHVFDGNKDLTIIDGSIVSAAENRFNFYKDLLLYRSRPELAERLLELGIDVFVTSLGRFEDKIAIVIGADYPDESVSQLWIDKETFLPIRWVIKDSTGNDGSGRLEIRYNVWWKVGQTRYPSLIEFYQDGNLVRSSQAERLEEDAPFSEALFNIEHLRRVYPRAPAHPVVSAEPEEPSEVQKTIDDFRRIFE